MSYQGIARALSMVLVTAVLGACTLWPHHKPASPLVGTWINRLGAVWTMNDNGTFEVDLTHDSRPDTHGTWSAEGDVLRLKSAPGKLLPENCNGEGAYHFTRTGPELRLRLIHDACKLRRTNVLLGWRMKH